MGFKVWVGAVLGGTGRLSQPAVVVFCFKKCYIWNGASLFCEEILRLSPLHSPIGDLAQLTVFLSTLLLSSPS
jgi:hypothetical protein